MKRDNERQDVKASFRRSYNRQVTSLRRDIKKEMTMNKLIGLVAALAATSPSLASSLRYPYPTVPIARPDFIASPFDSGRPHPPSPPRNRTCFVQPLPEYNGNGDEESKSAVVDDAPQILAAFHSCNPGGTVVLDGDYTIASPLDLTFLEHVDVALSGTVVFGNTVDYWSEHSFKYDFQNMSAYWQFGGVDVNIYGGGEGKIDGNGQPFWDQFALTPGMKRPILMVFDGVEGGSITGIEMINSPNVSWTTYIHNLAFFPLSPSFFFFYPFLMR
jgi:galacturan 1,4-alpha-galacturonidase